MHTNIVHVELLIPELVKRSIRVRRQQHIVGSRRQNRGVGNENYAVGAEEVEDQIDENETGSSDLEQLFSSDTWEQES